MGTVRVITGRSGVDMGSWHRASDEAGRVQVGIDGPGRTVEVSVLPGWRRAGGAESLGAATLAAYAAAARVRLTVWAEESVPIGTAAPVPAERGASEPVESLVVLRRAFRDMSEFRSRLTALGTTRRSVSDPQRVVTATMAGARIVGLELDERWVSSSNESDMGQRLGAVLTAALRAGVRWPAGALQGCPDLVSVLVRSSIPMPFEVDPAGTGVNVGRDVGTGQWQ